MNERQSGSEMLRALFALSSLGNVLGGVTLLLLVAAGVVVDPRYAVPVIAILIGGSMLIQGLYSFGYAQHWWSRWGSTASGALLAGQLLSLCAGVATVAYAIFYVERASNGGIEPGPFFSGVMIGANALLALIVLGTSGALTPNSRARAGT